MALPAEDAVLYSIIAFIVIENVIEIYLSMRQVSQNHNQRLLAKNIGPKYHQRRQFSSLAAKKRIEFTCGTAFTSAECVPRHHSDKIHCLLCRVSFFLRLKCISSQRKCRPN